MPAISWISESTEEEWIPQHRIKYFKKVLGDGHEEVVWDRETRLDKIFRNSQDPAQMHDNAEGDLVSEDGGVPLTT
jgi:hypothetical protein